MQHKTRNVVQINTEIKALIIIDHKKMKMQETLVFSFFQERTKRNQCVFDWQMRQSS